MNYELILSVAVPEFKNLTLINTDFLTHDARLSYIVPRDDGGTHDALRNKLFLSGFVVESKIGNLKWSGLERNQYGVPDLPLGSDNFVVKLEKILDRMLRPRKAGRPKMRKSSKEKIN